MWIQVRSMDGKKSIRVDGLSKLTKIEELREKLVDSFGAATDCQRLFYRGKQVKTKYSPLPEKKVKLQLSTNMLSIRPISGRDIIC